MKNPSRVRNTCISREDIFENCNMSWNMEISIFKYQWK
jgi:hypothetical protein